MAGLPNTPAEINRAAGAGALNVAQALDAAAALNTMFLNRFGGHDGMVAGGVDDAAATLIIESYGDLNNLVQVAYGIAGFAVQIEGGQLGPSNFFFHADALMGTVPR